MHNNMTLENAIEYLRSVGVTVEASPQSLRRKVYHYGKIIADHTSHVWLLDGSQLANNATLIENAKNSQRFYAE